MSELPLNIEIDHSLNGLKTWAEKLSDHEPLFILTDSNTRKCCLPVLKGLSVAFEKAVIIEIPAGEKSKTIHFLLEILEKLSTHQASRKSSLVNLGGGMICDIGGFAASIYKRGIPCVHVPTSLLAQLDAAIGGKNGVDFMEYKNLIGTINFPEKVFVSEKFLETLPDQEKRNGVAEALKHGLIHDRNYWDIIKNDPLKNTTSLIHTSIQIKVFFVTRDLFEQNIRKKLNAGHTVGHAIESWKLETETPISHGEAVAAGLIMESYLSNQLGHLASEELKEIEQVIFPLFGKVDLNGYNIDDLISRMKQDKKNSTRRISFSLIRKIGEASFDDHCEDELISKAFKYYVS